jgi:competence protein ComGC
MKQIIQNKKYKKGIVFLLFVIIMVSIIILTFLSSCKTNKPSISTQVSGNLRDTATIKVNLENNAK